MGVGTYLGFVGLSLVVGFAATRYDPAIVGQFSREVGLDGRKGWIVFLFAVLWAFFPFLAGAEMSDGGDFWVAGSAFALVGFYLLALAGSSLDEYRLLNRAPTVRPEEVSVGASEDVVATSGLPSVHQEDEDDALTPFTGVPAVHTDWLVQRRQRMGLRRTWKNLASGVTSAPFTLDDGRIAVESGRHRVFSDAQHRLAVEPEDDPPERVARFMRDHEDLPDPAECDERLSFVEQFVPAEEPVTVVGTARQGASPGQVVVDEAPPDELLGTHADYATSDGTEAEAVLVRGDAEAAHRRLRKRVFLLGTLGLVCIFGGQAVAFAFSAATLGPVF